MFWSFLISCPLLTGNGLSGFLMSFGVPLSSRPANYNIRTAGRAHAG